MIGIFDSGVGGLTVVKEVMKALPGYPVIYFGDTARTPYGNKSAKIVGQYALEDVQFLIKQGARLVVIGCNTISAVASSLIKRTFSLPIFEVITPVVQEALRCTKSGRIGVIGTRRTIESGAYRKKLKSQNLSISKAGKKLKIIEVACPLLVPLIEEGWADKRETEMVLETYLKPMKKQRIDTLILGCTHYPLLKNKIRKILGNGVTIIDSAAAVAHTLREWIRENGQFNRSLLPGQSKFFVSDKTKNFEHTAEKWLKRRIRLSLAKL